MAATPRVAAFAHDLDDRKWGCANREGRSSAQRLRRGRTVNMNAPKRHQGKCQESQNRLRESIRIRPPLILQAPYRTDVPLHGRSIAA
jgi:hypothetical protein